MPIIALILIVASGANLGCSHRSLSPTHTKTQPGAETISDEDDGEHLPSCRASTADDVICLATSVAAIVAKHVCRNGVNEIISRPATRFEIARLDIAPYLRTAFAKEGCVWTKDVKKSRRYRCISGPYLPRHLSILGHVVVAGSGQERTLSISRWCSTDEGRLNWEIDSWVYQVTTTTVAQAESWLTCRLS